MKGNEQQALLPVPPLEGTVHVVFCPEIVKAAINIASVFAFLTLILQQI